MKVCEVSIMVVCPEEDADTVAFELDEWFYGSDVGMFRHTNPSVSRARTPSDIESEGLDIELAALTDEARAREETHDRQSV